MDDNERVSITIKTFKELLAHGREHGHSVWRVETSLGVELWCTHAAALRRQVILAALGVRSVVSEDWVHR